MKSALASYCLALADDELITGHRLSEWTGHAPILEEDIAFANLALDEIGHARLSLGLAANALGEDPEAFPDQQAFLRPHEEFRNLQITELPNGDWAFCMLRQYLFDSFENTRLASLRNSSEKGLADIAGKIAIEEIYHLRHTQAWMLRLALGTDESTQRTQAALTALWSYAAQFADPLPGEEDLLAEKVIEPSHNIFEQWLPVVTEFLGTQCDLKVPKLQGASVQSRGDHTEHLAPLLEEMQQVARFDLEGRW